ncbi:DNA ligase 1-like [Clytia hemisphaerica]|uniref:DNA ligase 1-like n=1 Tax=Clytia hemisphaerica TaxID=252671 RepID=UPI0034D427E2
MDMCTDKGMSTRVSSGESTVASTLKDQVENPLVANDRTKDQSEDPTSENPHKRPNNDSVENRVPSKARKVGRFDLTSKDNENSLEIKSDLTEYAIKQMDTYITDTDIKEEIKFTHPVPDRPDRIFSPNKAFTSLQEKISNVLGPLSRVWEFLESQKDRVIEQTSQMEEKDLSEQDSWDSYYNGNIEDLDAEESDGNESDDETDNSESDSEEEIAQIRKKLSKKVVKTKKRGPKSKWPEADTDDLVDIILEDDKVKEKLLITSIKNVKNGNSMDNCQPEQFIEPGMDEEPTVGSNETTSTPHSSETSQSEARPAQPRAK